MMSEAQADMVLVEAGNLPVGPDAGLEDMELGERNLGGIFAPIGLRAWGSRCRSEVRHRIIHPTDDGKKDPI